MTYIGLRNQRSQSVFRVHHWFTVLSSIICSQCQTTATSESLACDFTNHIISAWKLHDCSFFRPLFFASVPLNKHTTPFPLDSLSAIALLPSHFLPRPNFLYYFLSGRVRLGIFGCLSFPGYPRKGGELYFGFSPRKEKTLSIRPKEKHVFTPSAFKLVCT